MKSLRFPAVSLLLGLASCVGSGSVGVDQIDTLDLKGEIIIPYDSLNQPGVIFATDSRLYLMNSMNVDTIIEEYTLDGKFVRRFLTKGNGPDQVPFIYYIGLNQKNNQLEILSQPFNLEGLNLDDNPSLSHIFTFEVPEGTDNSSLDASKPMAGSTMARLGDGSILAGNMSRGGLLAHFAPDGTFKKFYAPYPPKSEYGDGWPDYMVYNFTQPNIVVSPDGRNFAAKMGVADYLVFGELSGDSLKVTGSCLAPPKGINVELGDGWASFDYDDTYTEPFKSAPIMSEKRVYIQRNKLPKMEYLKLVKQMMEGEIPPEAVLTEYDFAGNIVGAIRIDSMPMSVAVTPDDKTIYVLTETAEDGIVVKRYNK